MDFLMITPQTYPEEKLLFSRKCKTGFWLGETICTAIL